MSRPAGGYISPVNIVGTALLVNNGQGSYTAPAAITLGANSGVRGVNIVHLARNVLGAMLVFPPAIRGIGDRCYVMNTDLIDPYVGIEMKNANDYLIKDIYSGTDHLLVRVVGGTGGAIENVAAHGQFLGAFIPPSWKMPDFGKDHTGEQLFKTCTVVEIDAATDQLIQACGQFSVQNGFVLRGGSDGKPVSATIRLSSCDSVRDDGIRLEGNAHALVIGYQDITSWRNAKALTTTADFTGNALCSGDLFRNLWLNCAGTGRVEIRGAVINWVPCKIQADGGEVIVQASLSEINAVLVAPAATFRADGNIDQKGALQTAASPNCIYAANAAPAQ